MRTTIAKWKNPIGRSMKVLEPLPEVKGKRVACVNGCGRMVAESLLICRKCKRTAKVRVLRLKPIAVSTVEEEQVNEVA